MAAEKEEIILEFVIDQKDALTDVEKLKKGITGLKQEQAELNTAFKKGHITIDEYAKEMVRVDALLKKQTSAYNESQKAITGVKTQLDKLITSNKEISKDFKNTSDQLKKTSDSFKDATSNIRVAGVSIGDVTAKLSSFANPAALAVSAVGALGAAYARSTIGAKDLAFAQNQLSEATTLITNSFASMISSAEDGDGALTKLLNNSLEYLANSPLTLGLRIAGVNLADIAKKSKELALIAEQMEDLQRTELELRTTANDRLADNQELMTDIQSEQTTYNQKLDKSNEIITNIARSQEEVKANLEEQLALVTVKLKSDKANEALLDAQLAIKKEIAAVDKDAVRRIQAIERLQNNLNEAEAKRLGEERKVQAGLKTSETTTSVSGVKSSTVSGSTLNPTDQQELDSANYLAAARKSLDDQALIDKQRRAQASIEITKFQTEQEIEAYKGVAMAISGVFEQGSELQRAFALISIGIDTAQAIASLTAASEGNPANSVTFGGAGILQYASGIIRILANIATAKQYLSGAAAGGGDFYTKGPALLMVGDNPGGVEKISVTPVSGKGKTTVNPNGNLVAMAGGGSITSGDPGKVITNSMTFETNQNLAMVNAIKKMPRPVVGVEEITRQSDRIQARENKGPRLI